MFTELRSPYQHMPTYAPLRKSKIQVSTTRPSEPTDFKLVGENHSGGLIFVCSMRLRVRIKMFKALPPTVDEFHFMVILGN